MNHHHGNPNRPDQRPEREFSQRLYDLDRTVQQASQPPGILASLAAKVRSGQVLPVALAAVASVMVGGGLVAAARSGGSETDRSLDPIGVVATTAAPTTPAAPTTVPSTNTPPANDPPVNDPAPVPATTNPPPATPPPVEDPPLAPPRDAPPEAPPENPTGGGDEGEDIGTRTTPAEEPVLFTGSSFVGRWVGANFVYTDDGEPGPEWLEGTTVQLRNWSGDTHQATVVSCGTGLRLDPPPPIWEGPDSYWYTDGAPFALSEVFDEVGRDAMNANLAAQGLDPTMAGSYGAPLAADGSADRVVWYSGGPHNVRWVATYDIETDTFTTIEGDPWQDQGYEIHPPSWVWHDLDNDGNLESYWFAGETRKFVEWGSEGVYWSSTLPVCP